MDLFGTETNKKPSQEEALQDIESQAQDSVDNMRLHKRVGLKIKVQAHAGNASDADKPAIVGVTGDISKGGCRVMFKRPPHVGDIYRLEFERNELELPDIYAHCVRCRMVHESAFEAGFSFFTSIKFSQGSSESNDLL